MALWTSLHQHSHFSLLDGFSQIDAITKKCIEQGYNATALTDHGSISGMVQFYKSCKAKNIKPIIGCELYIPSQDAKIQTSDNRSLSHLVVLAKNKKGLKNLIQIVSRSNDADLFYYKPRINLEMLGPFSDGLIAFSGHPGSTICNCIFKNKSVYSCKTKQQVYTEMHSDFEKRLIDEITRHKDIFGDNFYLEIQLIDKKCLPMQEVLADVLRDAANKTNTRCLATADSHYVEKADAHDQRLLLCSSMKTTFRKVYESLNTEDEFGLSGFFRSDNYHIPSLTEMQELHKGFEQELDLTCEIADSVEDYELIGRPRLPAFDCPDGMSELEYMKELCRQGWRKKLIEKGIIKNEEMKNLYGERMKKELSVFEQAGLEGYFLIVQDYVKWAKNQGYLVGPGRGSGAGCLSSYLLDITNIDPMPYDLLFERFYNSGRNTKDRVSLPDIDVDFPTQVRGKVIDYIKSKYGHDKVSQIITFHSLQGKGAMKEVLRVHEACDFETMNRITNALPDKAEIMDSLEDSGEHSIINWVLDNRPETVEQWCRKDDKGELVGEYSSYFKQAIRIEGTYTSSARHASGIIISKDVLSEVCPMERNKDGDKMCSIEMNGLEDMGHSKFDVLGVAILDKLDFSRKLVAGDI